MTKAVLGRRKLTFLSVEQAVNFIFYTKQSHLEDCVLQGRQ